VRKVSVVSLAVAISGLNSIRHTLDGLTRLAGYDRPIGSQVNVAVQTNVNLDLSNLAERLSKRFDHEPELKGRIAQALVEIGSIRRCGCTRFLVLSRQNGRRIF
jgi:hypothetical protein